MLFYVAQTLGVCPESVETFRRLALLTPKAFLRGKSATNPVLRNGPAGIFVGNMRDCFICGVDRLQKNADWFSTRISDGSIDGILADRRAAVKIWEEIVRLAGKVTCRDKATSDYILTSSIYGLRLFRMVEAGWDVMATGMKGDMLGHHDVARLRAAIGRYDRAKADYLDLPDERPDCATLFTDSYVRIGGTDAYGTKKLTTVVPGLGASVDRYRDLCANSNVLP